jgi:hypothetical protein
VRALINILLIIVRKWSFNFKGFHYRFFFVQVALNALSMSLEQVQILCNGPVETILLLGARKLREARSW